jgi:hypothetical protein
MANTEGISDETLDSLLSLNEGTKTLQLRLEMPIGERPAAKVIRSSRRPIAIPTNAAAYQATAAPEDIQEQSVGASVLVGEIVERTRTSTQTTENSQPTTKKLSRFAKQQRQLEAPSGAGFPSLNAPLGTFVRPRSNPTKQQPKTIVHPTKQQSSLDLVSSQKEAQAMLEQMTAVEIHESVQELQTQLSPDMIEFLKNRKKTPLTVSNTQTVLLGVERSEEDAINEKIRISQALSAVKTYDDIDAVYEREMGSDVFPNDDNYKKTDFELANELLRSNNSRQALWAAKIVAESLAQDLCHGRTCSLQENARSPTPWPYPLTLVVSLRCRLDSTFGTNGSVLYGLVLQSLYSLLQLRACQDHVVDVSGSRLGLTDIYQLYFMNDAVPMPFSSNCYLADTVTPLTIQESDAAVAYSTASSSKSALSDGEAFARDPMWTLLSKMRILPRLAHLLQMRIPIEGVVAACGILAMIGQRSPGAATAIVQHETLLRSIVQQSLLTESAARCDPLLGQSVIILLHTLARQSRVAAQGLEGCIDVDSIILRALAFEASNGGEFRLQQRAVLLWRTLLNYGLGLTMLQPLLTIATERVSLGHAPFCIAPDFFVALACVSDCIRYAKRVPTAELNAPDDIVLILSKAGLWLSSFLRHAMRHISSPHVANVSFDDRLRLLAACFRFIESSLLLSGERDFISPGKFKADNISQAQETLLLESLNNILATNEFKEAVACAVVPFFITGECTSEAFMIREAVSSYFIMSIVSLVSILSDCSQFRIQELVATSRLLADTLLAAFDNAVGLLSTVVKPSLTAVQSNQRIGWLNRMHARMVQFFVTRNGGSPAMRKGLVFSLLGRLRCGDEDLAVILLSCDEFFGIHKSELHGKAVSPISTMLVRELCGSKCSRNQLDHSFKLHRGFGITTAGHGAFGLQTLLSHAEGVSKDDQILPLGPFWLWQTLAGTVLESNEHVESNDQDFEPSQVIETTLQLITDLESSNNAYLQYFSSSCPPGANCYYLVNICLHPGTILRCDNIQLLSGKLVDGYLLQGRMIAPGFIRACNLHSAKTQKRHESENNLLRNEQVFKALLESPLSDSDTSISKDAMESLQAFVSDLCDAFIENGAQYLLFGKCIRLFLLPGFPTKIRCDLLHRLSGLLHLLSSDEDSMSTLLLSYVGGLPSMDYTPRDPPAFLDALTAVFPTRTTRIELGFLSSLTIAVLARSLTIGLIHDGIGLSPCKARIQSLHHEIAVKVLEATASFIATRMTAKDLVDSVVMSMNASRHNVFPVDLHLHASQLEYKWDKILEIFHSILAA